MNSSGLEFSVSNAVETELIEIIRVNNHTLLPIKTDKKPLLTDKLSLRAILFDIYGTLVISASGDIAVSRERQPEELFAESLKRAGAVTHSTKVGIEAFNFYQEAITASHSRTREKGIQYPEVEIREIWLEVINQLIDKKLITVLNSISEFALKVAVYFETLSNPSWPMPGTREVIASLREKGIPLGIVSNSQFYTPFLFEAFFGSSYADMGFSEEYCVWSYREKRAKPDPSLMRQALRSLNNNGGISPSHVLYVGNDMLNDVFAAKTAGCKTALFAGDKRSLRLREDDQRCKDFFPDFVLTDLLQLKVIV